MNELERIHDRLHRAMHGPAWHGPSLEELLQGLTPEQAASHPIDGAHSIWEIVRHLTCWHRTVMRRVRGEAYSPTDEEDWPHVPAVNAQAWETAQEEMYRSGRELMDDLQTFPLEKMEEDAPKGSFDYSHIIHGVIEHDLYHAGQIALLKKRLDPT